MTPRTLTVKGSLTNAGASTLSHPRGNPLTLRVTPAPDLLPVAGATLLRGEIRNSRTDAQAVPPVAALATSDVASPAGAGPWDIEFTGAQMNQDLQGKPSRVLWLAVYFLTAGGSRSTQYTASLTLTEDGASMSSALPPVVDVLLNKSDGDALYAPLALTDRVDGVTAGIATLSAQVQDLANAQVAGLLNYPTDAARQADTSQPDGTNSLVGATEPDPAKRTAATWSATASAWLTNPNALEPRTARLETQLDTAVQLSGRTALVVDAAARAVLWQEDGRVDCEPGPRLLARSVEAAGIDQSAQTGAATAILLDADGRAPMWLDRGKVDCEPGPRMLSRAAVAAGVTWSSQRTTTAVPLFEDQDGRVPMWMDRGLLGVKGFTPDLLGYLNAALNLTLPPITEWDIWMVCGQSNQVGLSDEPAKFIDASAVGKKFDYDGSLKPLTDPCGTSSTFERNSRGSAWPAFAKGYNAATGRGVIIVPAAYGGTTSTEWRPDSAVIKAGDDANLFNISVARLNAAISAAQAAGLKFTVRGVAWEQGEGDGAISKDDHKANLAAAVSGWRAQFGDSFEMLIGVMAHRGDPATYAHIRQADREFARENAHVRIGAELTDVYSRGWVQADRVHITQDGLNAYGAAMGRTAALSPRIQIPH